MLAYDTRPSAEELVKAAGSGVQALGGLPIVCGRLTTPQLHWMVSTSSSERSSYKAIREQSAVQLQGLLGHCHDFVSPSKRILRC